MKMKNEVEGSLLSGIAKGQTFGFLCTGKSKISNGTLVTKLVFVYLIISPTHVQRPNISDINSPFYLSILDTSFVTVCRIKLNISVHMFHSVHVYRPSHGTPSIFLIYFCFQVFITCCRTPHGSVTITLIRTANVGTFPSIRLNPLRLVP